MSAPAQLEHRRRGILHEFEVERRLADLPRRARMLADHLDNDEDDPLVVVVGLPYEAVMRAAFTDPDVRDLVRRLPRDWRGE